MLWFNFKPHVTIFCLLTKTRSRSKSKRQVSEWVWLIFISSPAIRIKLEGSSTTWWSARQHTCLPKSTLHGQSISVSIQLCHGCISAYPSWNTVPHQLNLFSQFSYKTYYHRPHPIVYKQYNIFFSSCQARWFVYGYNSPVGFPNDISQVGHLLQALRISLTIFPQYRHHLLMQLLLYLRMFGYLIQYKCGVVGCLKGECKLMIFMQHAWAHTHCVNSCRKHV